MTRSEIVGKNIHKYRTQIGMSQIDFAIAIGRSQTMVSMYENGSRLPSTKILAKIAKVLGVPFGNLYYGPEEHTESEINESESSYTSKTPEARIVSFGMDQLPEEQRQLIVDVVRTMFSNQPDLFKSREE